MGSRIATLDDGIVIVRRVDTVIEQQRGRLFMKFIKNNRGYTLVLVLLIITLIFSISAVLIAKNINSAKQVKETENHYEAIALAEMGIEYGEAVIQDCWDSWKSDSTLLTAILNDVADLTPEQATKVMAEIIKSKVEDNIPIDSNFSVSLTYQSVVDAEDPEKYTIIFSLVSIGGDNEYTITADVVSMAEIAVTSTGGTDDTDDFYEERGDFPTFSATAGEIRETVVKSVEPSQRPGGTFSGINVIESSPDFGGSITLSPNTSFTINGSVMLRGIQANDVNEINIRDNFYLDAGNGEMNRINAFHVGGHLGGSTPMTFNDIKNITVGRDVAVQGTLTFNRSVATFDGYTALNRLVAEESTIKVRNFRPSEVSLTNSDLLVRGSVLSEWGGSVLTNSTWTVLGDLFGEAPIQLKEGSTLIIGRDIELGNAWEPIKFTGVGSRVIIFGEAFANNWHSINSNVQQIHVSKFADAVVKANANVIYFVEEEFSTSIIDENGGSGSGTGDGDNGDEGIVVTLESISLDNVQYEG